MEPLRDRPEAATVPQVDHLEERIVEQRLHVSNPADGVGQILIDAPPRNVPLPPLWQQFEAALEELRESGHRVVVVGSSVEGYFIGHGSLESIISYFSGEEVGGDTMAQPRVSRELDRGPMISIAAVDGQAWGGGAELSWACDLRVASEAATLAQPEVNIGLTPGFGGAAKLARLAGEAAALRVCLDGRPIGATEAQALGLVHRVVPPGGALDAAVEWGAWLAQHPGLGAGGEQAAHQGQPGRHLA